MQGNSTRERVEAMRRAPSYEDYHDSSIGTPDKKGYVTTSVQEKRNMLVQRSLFLNEQVAKNDVESKKLTKEMNRQEEMNAQELKILNKQQKAFNKEFGEPEVGQTYEGRPINADIFNNVPATKVDPKSLISHPWWEDYDFSDNNKEKKEKGDLKF